MGDKSFPRGRNSLLFHSYSVNVYSELGHGTTFTIYLPRYVGQDISKSEGNVGSANNLGQLGKETILLVEDEPSLLELSKSMLEKQGYTVLTASSPAEAEKIAENHTGKIHLLLTDVVLPEMNGKDLSSKLLSMLPHLKCLFVSGYTADVIAQRGMLEKDVNFLQKPFSRKNLIKTVQEILLEPDQNSHPKG